MIETYLPWLLSAITIYTMFLAGSINKATWLVGLANQALWLVWIFAAEAWGLLRPYVSNAPAGGLSGD